MGMMCALGYGVEQSYEKALEWCEKAADLGDPDAVKNVETFKRILSE